MDHHKWHQEAHQVKKESADLMEPQGKNALNKRSGILLQPTGISVISDYKWQHQLLISLTLQLKTMEISVF